jgi:hypothetical protein
MLQRRSHLLNESTGVQSCVKLSAFPVFQWVGLDSTWPDSIRLLNRILKQNYITAGATAFCLSAVCILDIMQRLELFQHS